MTDEVRLTEPQRLMLLAVADTLDGMRAKAEERGQAHPDVYVTPRQMAQVRWPDSEAWNRHTSRHDGKSGAAGGTMPMKAATMLGRLERLGLTREGYGEFASHPWRLTAKGERVVEHLRSLAGH